MASEVPMHRWVRFGSVRRRTEGIEETAHCGVRDMSITLASEKSPKMKNRFERILSPFALAGALSLIATACSKPTDVTVGSAPSTTIGTEIDDSVLTTRIKSALLSDPDIKSLDFKIETRKGKVQLSGFVDNQAQIDRAAEIARKEPGVTAIENNLVLKGAPTTVGNVIDDSVVTTRVRSALLADDQIHSLDIAVVTRKAEVQLSGYVDTEKQIQRAVDIAKGVDGVRSVSNEMSVKK